MTHGTLSDFIVAPSSSFYHGSFGRICSKLAPWHPPQVPTGASDAALEAHFLQFANEFLADHPGLQPHEISDRENKDRQADRTSDSTIPAGYTYFGQFIDHDVTHDITPLSESEVDPNKLRNFRTPRLDLDCVYGSGPQEQPYLYEHQDGVFTGRLLVSERTATVDGKEFQFLDLNRTQIAVGGRAIIGDMRNDENAIVAQIQLAFVLGHNRLVDAAKALDPTLTGHQAFDQARRTLIWLYQWILWNDFVQRIVVPDMHACALRREAYGAGFRWELGLRGVYSWKHQPFMPVEFSVAAYRFGHSMARNSYQTNSSPAAGLGVFFPLFNIHRPLSADLSGFRRLELRTVVQWDWFLHMANSPGSFPQRAHRIDTKLSNALAALRENPGSPGHFDNVLAARNLVRAVRMKLPSGTAVAEKFGIQPISIDEANEPNALWYYILKEAEVQNDGERLGATGSTIVAATFAGLLKGDPMSWMNQRPNWDPDTDPLLQAVVAGHAAPGGDIPPNDLTQDQGLSNNPPWSLASIIRLSGLPIDAASFAH